MKTRILGFLKLAISVVAVAVSAHAGATALVMGDTSGNNQTDVEGTINYSVSASGSDSYVFSFTLQNTTTLTGTRLTGIAFDLLDNATQTGHTSPSGWGFDGTSPTLPGEPLAFDVCWYSGPNCGAGGSTGLLNSDPALGGFSVTFTLTGYSNNAANVEAAYTSGFEDGSLNACVRVISIPKTGEGSGNGAGSDVACADGGTQVPAPATLALLGLGALGLGFSRRRKQA